MGEKRSFGNKMLTVVFVIISVIYMIPIFEVLMNSFKANSFVNTDTFALPNAESFVGWDNYVKGMTFGNYPFLKSVFFSLFITVVSTVLILLCTSMAAWYIVRVNDILAKIMYYLCLFSMIVPFQMVMFTMSKIANMIHLDNPIGIIVLYVGFGCGMSTFMFAGFIKSIPLALEEAAMIDGAGPVKTFFQIVMPMLKSTAITIAILQTMWVWNDYLLPYLTLDSSNRTIPVAIQYLRGGYGSVDMGAMMAMLVLAMLPVIIFYLSCQKYIIKGVLAGAVKG